MRTWLISSFLISLHDVWLIWFDSNDLVWAVRTKKKVFKVCTISINEITFGSLFSLYVVVVLVEVRLRQILIIPPSSNSWRRPYTRDTRKKATRIHRNNIKSLWTVIFVAIRLGRMPLLICGINLMRKDLQFQFQNTLNSIEFRLKHVHDLCCNMNFIAHFSLFIINMLYGRHIHCCWSNRNKKKIKHKRTRHIFKAAWIWEFNFFFFPPPSNACNFAASYVALFALEKKLCVHLSIASLLSVSAKKS